MEAQSQNIQNANPVKRGALLTWIACMACVAIFLDLMQKGNYGSWAVLSKFGYLSPNDIWDRKYWGLITSIFVHTQLWHVAFNVYWLWILGGALERSIGHPYWLIFVVMAALVSSGIQFGVSGSTGIGFSGVGYGMFGFMWVARNRYPEFKQILTKQIVLLFIGWLIMCMIASLLHLMDVGNGAHIGGLLFGTAASAIFTLKYKTRLVSVGMGALIFAALLPLFWCPWSAQWVGRQGYKAHVNHDYEKAILNYQRSMELGADPQWALSNIAEAYGDMGNNKKQKETLEQLQKFSDKETNRVNKPFHANRFAACELVLVSSEDR